MKILLATILYLLGTSILLCQMQEYPLLKSSDFESRRFSEFTRACEKHNVKFTEFYIEVDDSEEFFELVMSMINLLEDPLVLVEVEEERNDYLVKIHYKEASLVIRARDKVYPHVLTMVDEINSFLEEVNTDKRLYLWPLLEDETLVFAQEPSKLISFSGAGGYDPTILSPDFNRISLDNLSGIRIRVSFDDVKYFDELNESFIKSFNSLQERSGRTPIPSDRIGLFKKASTGQIKIVANDQSIGSLFLDTNDVYLYGVGYSLLILQEVLTKHNYFDVKYVNVSTEEEVTLQREDLLKSIQLIIEKAIGK